MDKILAITLVVLTIVLWFTSILDITRSRFKNSTMNIVWLLIVLFFPVIGSIVYLQFGRKNIQKEPRKFQPQFNKRN